MLTHQTREKLTEYGLRCTCQRVALYEALCDTNTHPTAEELYRLVKPSPCPLSLATVYNTLEVFCSVGLVQKLPTADGRFRYDADTSAHLHVVIGEDAEIRDVPPELGRRLIDTLSREVIEEIEGALGVEIGEVKVELSGRRSKKIEMGKNGVGVENGVLSRS